MSTFGELSISFKNMSSNLKSNVRSVLLEESKSVLSDLQARSPVDTGTFRANWKVVPSRFSSGDTYSSITIENKTPYAYFMEYGAEKSKAPWYYPHRDKATGRFKKGTGKLKGAQGKIWAGGLSPGHTKTIGGAITPTLLNSNKRLKALANKVADAVIVGFK